MRKRYLSLVFGLFSVVSSLLTACSSSTTHGPMTVAASQALTKLSALTVEQTRSHHAGYQRSCDPGDACSFGAAWTDDTSAPDGDNGCDTRDDVLREQLTDVRYRSGSDCVIVAGTLADPYTGKTMTFSKAHSATIQIDHVVPLALAWDLGAATWSQTQRDTYANDTSLVLLAVNGEQNQAKGDSGPAQWMPANRSYWCAYDERFVSILSAYKLAVTRADAQAIRSTLSGC